MKRGAVILILILSLCGLADSAYLAQHEATGAPLLCDIKNLSGCNIVATSQYSHLFGFSVADYGLLFYGLIFVLAALELAVMDRLLRRLLQIVSGVGLVASAYFTALQFFVIHALCIYCLASALIAFLVFALATRLEPLGRSEQGRAPEPVPAP